MGQKEIVARDKGEHSYYKQKSRALHGVEESIAWWRSNKGTGRLQRSFYRGAGSRGHDIGAEPELVGLAN